jgi:hypothetical protein
MEPISHYPSDDDTMNRDYLPIMVFLAFFSFNVIAGITLYLGYNPFNTEPLGAITIGQLLFLIFAINGPLLCIIGYAFYKQKKKSKEP